jgi:hypothetical protein
VALESAQVSANFTAAVGKIGGIVLNHCSVKKSY